MTTDSTRVTGEEIAEVATVVTMIKKADYFLHVWETVKHKKPLQECTYSELMEPFQDFWEALPDSRHIQRHPFTLVCDLAEKFCIGRPE